MTARIKKRDVFILLTVLGALLFEACTLILKPIRPEATTCSGSDLDLFEGCFGDPGGDRIRITPGDPPADSENCSDFMFSGDGSGIFPSPDEIWSFTGGLIGGDTAGVEGDGVPNNMRLTFDRDAGQLIVKIWDEDETEFEDGALRTRRHLDPYPCPD